MTNQSARTTYKVGDIIGQKYEVRGMLGSGGFGDVYLVYRRESEELVAMKTLHKEFLADDKIRKLFQKEANILVEIESHPYLVRTYYIEEISNLLFIIMEYVAPNTEDINTLSGYLQGSPLSLVQTLRWAIQICMGMEYAYSKGIKAHRDIKPDNILISSDGMPKISDFGLAGVLEISRMGSTKSIKNARQSGKTQMGAGFGTPTHMPPEQFYSATDCDQRSDIYSFGIMLFQMASGGEAPFWATPPKNDWQDWLQIHRESPVPELSSPLYPIILRCLEKKPDARYQSFAQLCSDLETLLKRQNGEVVKKPQMGENNAMVWLNKGYSLMGLKRYEEAIRCFDEALEIDPRDAKIWNNKGSSLSGLKRYEESIHCFDKALEIDPRKANVWNNKGGSLNGLERHEEAIRCLDEALEINPRYVMALNNKGISLDRLGRYEEAVHCFDKALEIDPRHLKAWFNKGISLDRLGRYEETIRCYDEALEIDPRDAKIWNNKGSSLSELKRYEEAIHCCDAALKIDPRLAAAWGNKGNSLNSLGRYKEAIHCCDAALKIDPRYVIAWDNKGNSLNNLGRYEEAIRCYDKVLEIDPRYTNAWNNKGNSLRNLERYEEAILCLDEALKIDPRYAKAWNNKGSSLNNLGRYEEAIRCYDEVLEIDPRYEDTWYNKGDSLFALGYYEEAIHCVDEALKIDPRDVLAWLYKGVCLNNLGRYEEAVQSYEQYLALAPAQDKEQIESVRREIKDIRAKNKAENKKQSPFIQSNANSHDKSQEIERTNTKEIKQEAPARANVDSHIDPNRKNNRQIVIAGILIILLYFCCACGFLSLVWLWNNGDAVLHAIGINGFHIIIGNNP